MQLPVPRVADQDAARDRILVDNPVGCVPYLLKIDRHQSVIVRVCRELVYFLVGVHARLACSRQNHHRVDDCGNFILPQAAADRNETHADGEEFKLARTRAILNYSLRRLRVCTGRACACISASESVALRDERCQDLDEAADDRERQWRLEVWQRSDELV